MPRRHHILSWQCCTLSSATKSPRNTFLFVFLQLHTVQGHISTVPLNPLCSNIPSCSGTFKCLLGQRYLKVNHDYVVQNFRVFLSCWLTTSHNRLINPPGSHEVVFLPSPPGPPAVLQISSEFRKITRFIIRNGFFFPPVCHRPTARFKIAASRLWDLGQDLDRLLQGMGLMFQQFFGEWRKDPITRRPEFLPICPGWRKKACFILSQTMMH